MLGGTSESWKGRGNANGNASANDGGYKTSPHASPPQAMLARLRPPTVGCLGAVLHL
jgi:hypothetical protein